jgi:branched-chain amino acid transport system permease protein
MSQFLQQILNGLTLGSIYALIALGYTMVYGILELINFAHGEIYMIGAFLGFILFSFLMPILGMWISLVVLLVLVFVAAMMLTSAYGATMQHVAYRPLRQANRLNALISALGVSIFLQNFVMVTQGSAEKVFPDILTNAGITLGEVNISYVQIIIIATSLVLMVALTLFINRTKLGITMRATAQDMKMATLSGINLDFIIALTFIIGSGLGAAAGVMVMLYYRSINFFIGYLAGLKAFTAAVLGGIGNIPGAMLGGLLLGLIEALGAGYISSEYKDVYAFVILIILLIFRPSGILGENVREKV